MCQSGLEPMSFLETLPPRTIHTDQLIRSHTEAEEMSGRSKSIETHHQVQVSTFSVDNQSY